MRINKGFLSELENGKRHFPEGIIQQLSEELDINFDDTLTSYLESRQYLYEIYTDLFYQKEIEQSAIQSLEFKSKKYINSLGFFNILIIHFFESFYILKDQTKTIEIKRIIDDNITCLKTSELSIYYSFVGLFYSTKNNPLLAKDYFEKSIFLCSTTPLVYSLNTFYLI